MAIIRSFGALQNIAAPTPTWSSAPSGGLDYACTYAAIYRTQPNVRTVVDFIARNCAQLGIHVFRRVSDTDRERLSDHPLSLTLRQPNPYTTGYRLIESLLQDLGVYMNAFWIKVRMSQRLGLVRLPPEQVTVVGGLFPTGYKWTTANGEVREYGVDDVVHFGGYDPANTLVGLSPIETLRQLLAEESAAAVHRQAYWRNAARTAGYIKRPKEAGKWSKIQRDAFKADWAQYQGANNTGKTPVLEDGMEFVATQHTARDSELTVTRKLTREECAAAYHVPLPMVGILDHATFSNIKEQHKHLYADCLGPTLAMIQQELIRQVLPEFEDTDKVYIEFNIAEKLKGSFEEQADSLLKLTGRPIMTLNESRARINLPSISKPEADDVALPLNMSDGSEEGEETEAPPDKAAVSAAILQNWERQQARTSKEDNPAAFFARTLNRWDRELADDLRPFYGAQAERIASTINGETLAHFNAGKNPFSREATVHAEQG